MKNNSRRYEAHSTRAAAPQTRRLPAAALNSSSTTVSSASNHEQDNISRNSTTNNSGEEHKLPVPLAVVRQALSAYSTVASWSSAPLRVEVETTQGYVYTGRMADMDIFYNVTLTEAMVRRERACDVLQALLQQRHDALLASLGPEMATSSTNSAAGVSGLLSSSSSSSAAAAAAASRGGAVMRQRFVGTVLLRSSSVVMVRFLADVTRSTMGQDSNRTDGSLARDASHRQEARGGIDAAAGEKTSDGVHDTRVELERAFGATAAMVRKSLLQMQRKNREGRRKRIGAQEAKKTTR